jgi:hypothetical protein
LEQALPEASQDLAYLLTLPHLEGEEQAHILAAHIQVMVVAAAAAAAAAAAGVLVDILEPAEMALIA